MEFDLRQWLLILGPLFIAGVLVHGYFRMRAGQNDIRMKLDKNFVSRPGESVDDVDDLNLLRAELPNGGARVIGQPDLDEDVPLLMESVELPSISALDEPGDSVPVARRHTVNRQSVKPEQQSLDIASPEPAEQPVEKKAVDKRATRPKAPPAMAEEAASQPVAKNADTRTASKDASTSTSEATHPEASDAASRKVAAEKPESKQSAKESSGQRQQKSAEQRSAVEKPEKFVVMHVLALDEPFKGQALLGLLIEANMTFGEMEIFHRLDASGDPLFSLASAVEPGTFNPAAMERFSTPGVTLFMRVHELEKPVEILDEMLLVADAIAQELGGEVRDETRSVMTPQTIEHCRQSIRDFQFKHSA